MFYDFNDLTWMWLYFLFELLKKTMWEQLHVHHIHVPAGAYMHLFVILLHHVAILVVTSCQLSLIFSNWKIRTSSSDDNHASFTYVSILQVSSILHGYDHWRSKKVGSLFMFWLFIRWWCQKIFERFPSITISWS